MALISLSVSCDGVHINSINQVQCGGQLGWCMPTDYDHRDSYSGWKWVYVDNKITQPVTFIVARINKIIFVQFFFYNHIKIY